MTKQRLITEVRYAIWLYFLPVTNPRRAWKLLKETIGQPTQVRE